MSVPDLEWLPVLVASTVVIIAIKFWLRCRGLPPGPMGLPILGFYPFLDNNDIYAQFEKFRKKYGDVFSFRTFGGDLVVIVNKDAVKESLVDKSDEFTGRAKQLNVLNYFDDGLGIAQSEGNDWKEKRKFFIAQARVFGFGKTEHEDYMHQLITDMMADIKELGDAPIDIRQQVIYVSSNTIAKIMCDTKFSKDDHELSDMVKGFDQIVGGGLTTFFLVGLIFKLFLKFTPTGRTRIKEVNRLRKVVADIVDRHVKTYDPMVERDFIDAYLAQMESLKKKNQLIGSSFNLESLRSITLNMLMEGTESTGTTAAGFFLKLAQYPDVQKKIQEELDEVVGQSRLPSWTDRHKLPYLDATLQELFRTSVFLYLTVFYSNFEDASIRGYRIPKRSLISANFWPANNDPDVFPDPSEFRPERFLGPDGQRIKTSKNPIAFGAGKRSCVGESLAQMEVFIIIGSLLQNFTLKPSASQPFHLHAQPRNL